ncbi:RNA-directed DNA polymerase from mobile element jockey [Plakobranchus ocellatus]|uniref:RNA-directed DNA polymerase from mobile element jockey n=1 Tax=Plakobranchus ocellatus TaxID=259542 RepID=A0AAV4AW97_9GAST|nr:RNA-directed DNA polymerase from mobile element jockey [Plakobranchus ocellatus]
MCWKQTAAMRVENKTSTFQYIKRGIRQGCVLSPDLFSLYSEIIMRNLENHPGIKCYIEPVLMYGYEAWTISKQIQDKLESTEMWFLRSIFRIPWTAKKTNERVLNEAN